jgi:cytoskeletal protein CcmA (bactofilin family)
MRHISSLGVIGASMIATIGALPANAEVRSGEEIILGATEVIDEDLYLFGSTVRVNGTVRGDLIAAGMTVEINGRVHGDVLSAGGDIRIAGPVAGSIRSAGGKVTIENTIGEDVFTAGGSILIARGAHIGRDAMIAGNEAQILGPIARNLQAAAGRLELGSTIDGNVDAAVNTLEVKPETKIAGTLSYQSPAPADIPPAATVGAQSHTVLESAGVASFIYRWTRAIIGFAALGFLLALLSPRFVRALPETLKAAPLKSVGWGAVALLGAPIAAVLLFVLGGLLGGWWIGLIALGTLIVALAVSFPAIAYVVGLEALSKVRSEKVRRTVALVVGLAALMLLVRIPILGGLVAFTTILVGLGALLRTGFALRRAK